MKLFSIIPFLVFSCNLLFSDFVSFLHENCDPIPDKLSTSFLPKPESDRINQLLSQLLVQDNLVFIQSLRISQSLIAEIKQTEKAKIITFQKIPIDESSLEILKRVKQELVVLIKFQKSTPFKDGLFVQLIGNCYYNPVALAQNICAVFYQIENYQEKYKFMVNLSKNHNEQFCQDFDTIQRLEFYISVAKQINELHQNNLVLNNIDPARFYLVEKNDNDGAKNYAMKIFGFSGVTKENELVNAFTMKYSDLETTKTRIASKANDIFALGIAFAEIEMEKSTLYNGIEYNNNDKMHMSDLKFWSKLQKIRNIEKLSKSRNNAEESNDLILSHRSFYDLIVFMTKIHRSDRIHSLQDVIAILKTMKNRKIDDRDK